MYKHKNTGKVDWSEKSCNLPRRTKGKSTYRVFDRKTGKEMRISFGPQTEEILRYYFNNDPSAELVLK